MTTLFKNNTASTLASNLATAGTSMTVATGHGDRFPVVASPDIAFVTMENAAGNIEIVKITARTAGADSMTIVRGQEGTTARDWVAGDIVSMRITAASIQSALSEVREHVADTVDAHDATAISYAGNTNLSATTVEGALDELDNEKQPLDATLTALAGLDSAAGLVEQTGADTFVKTAKSSVGAGKQTIWIPAGAMIPQITNGASQGAIEIPTSSHAARTLDFDTAVEEYAQFVVRMPKSWNEGTLTAMFLWSHAATATNFGVRFLIQAVAISNDDSLQSVFGTAQGSVDTGGTTNDLYTTPESAAITVAGTPAAEDLVAFRVYRVVADAGDTLAVDARLHGVVLFYTTDANTDA